MHVQRVVILDGTFRALESHPFREIQPAVSPNFFNCFYELSWPGSNSDPSTDQIQFIPTTCGEGGGWDAFKKAFSDAKAGFALYLPTTPYNPNTHVDSHSPQSITSYMYHIGTGCYKKDQIGKCPDMDKILWSIRPKWDQIVAQEFLSLSSSPSLSGIIHDVEGLSEP